MIGAEIEVVVFDAVGTLLHPEPPAATVYAEVGQRFGACYSAEEIGRRFSAAFAGEEQADRVAGRRTSADRERRRWRHIVAGVLDDVSDSEACFTELYRHFGRPEAWRCQADTAAVLQRLSARGYRLALASNYDCRLRAVVAGLAELRFIESLIISSEIGWRKPAKPFFDAMCHAVEAPPQRILYIGDDPVNDYEGAASAGIPALLFDPQGRRLDLSTCRLRRLADLLGG